MSDPYRICVVCLGNICRSPTAQVVLRDRLEAAGLDDRVEVDSAGTSRWEVGNPIDERAGRLLSERTYTLDEHQARQFTVDWFDRYDLVLAMDATNLSDLDALAPDEQSAAKVRMFRSFDPESGEHDDEVPDPWYGGEDGFVEVLAMIERTADALVEQLAERVASS